MRIDLIKGDCLEEMAKLPDNSIDLCLTDPPYGTTACKWDTVIPFEPMWEQLHRIVKDNGAICLFGSEPFSSALRMSNIKRFKYDWVWEKKKPTGQMQAKNKPLNIYEKISVFTSASMAPNLGLQPCYYPETVPIDRKMNMQNSEFLGSRKTRAYHQKKTGYPKNLIKFDNVMNKGFHPTQKPVPLLEYLIKTYTLKGETVLDFTMGSGSTGVAAKNLNRSFIGIEQDDKYFDIARQRINDSDD